MKVIKTTTDSLSVESEYGGSRDNLTPPKSTACVMMSLWLVDHIRETLINLSHPKIEIAKKEEVALKEALTESARTASYLTDLLRDYASSPSPNCEAPNIPRREECVRAIDQWIVGLSYSPADEPPTQP